MLTKLDFFQSLTREKGFHVGFHQHACYELVYYLNGGGQTCFEGQNFRFGPNMFSVIESLVSHDEWHDTASDVIFIGFQIPSHLYLPSGFFQEESVGAGYPVRSLMLRMKEEFVHKKPLYEEKLDLLTGELIIELCRIESYVQTAPSRNDKLHYVRNYMNEHFQQKLEQSELAQLAGYSYDRFRHLFKEINGCSPQRYILNKRLEHARFLLRQSGRSISDIALDSGFSTDAQFCQLFRREHGQSPGKYRISAQSLLPR
ncbi:AraC family transcriptional regulator [Paenibacillus nasutitermitis]|uniref:HTH araC/xylS-type domain-containing protein n=1 Tax=Paenibacillus nasutitermitis TaxID=1652958 RepID=A0A917DNK1_9BACL|nr:AraC family transcriptional regulator [Paenibacillus nasutitermitis]GGD51456.1 hypothetical protein GCM10010911_06240 [Paenibacillus nasutitermitis]